MEFDPTKHITIADHVAALRLQQAAFDDDIASVREGKESAEAALYEKDEALSALDAMKAAILNPELDDKATLEAIAAKIVEAETPKKEKRKAELRKIIADAEAELDAGKTKKP